jgi:hypothetical protein
MMDFRMVFQFKIASISLTAQEDETRNDDWKQVGSV